MSTDQLGQLTQAVNWAAFKYTGIGNTCITSSFALQYVLRLFGYNARVLRVTADVDPLDGSMGVFLGPPPCGCFRPAAGPGMWYGHVAVLVNGCWLCDPTLDQANQKNIRVSPCVLHIPRHLLDKPADVQWHLIGNCRVRYNTYGRQVGFRHAPEARPIRWRLIAEEALWRYGKQRAILATA